MYGLMDKCLERMDEQLKQTMLSIQYIENEHSFIYFASNVRAMTADTYGAAEDVPSKVNVHSLLRANVAWE